MKKRFLPALICLLLLSGIALAEIDEQSRTVLYKASVSATGKILDQPDGKTVRYVRKGYYVDILGFDPKYLYVRCFDSYGYLLRDKVENVRAVDDVNTPPYGVEVFTYTAVITRDTPVLFTPEEDGEVLDVLTKGAKVALLGAENGYMKLVHKRFYGYIDSRLLDEIRPVAGNVSLGDRETPLAAYCTFFNDNPDRINNLVVACRRLERVMKPGESLNFNDSVGPFSKANGYLPAPVLIDGVTKMGYGGGSCQISSTLYNVVLQLPGLNVLERHPHGANGAAYLPHGVDASSGDLNFRFSNGYDFPIRIEASCHDLCLFIAIYREGDER